MSFSESEASSRYPNTAFLNNFAIGPAQTRLLHGAYVAEYLSGGRQWMREHLGAIMVADQAMWSPDVRADLPEAISILDASFKGGLGYDIARSDPLGTYLAHTLSARADRAARLTATWQTMHRQFPTYGDADRETALDIRARLPDMRDEDERRSQASRRFDALVRAMLYIDIRAFGDHPTVQSPPEGESIFREAVLAKRSTGLKHLDVLLGGAYEHVLIDLHARPLAMLKQAWERHHPGESFYPDVYKKDRPSIAPIDKLLRPFFLVWGSLLWWSAYGNFDLQDKIEY